MTFLLTFIATIGLSFLMGHFVAESLRISKEFMAIKPILGFAIILISSSLAYRAGMSASAISLLTWVFGIVGASFVSLKFLTSPTISFAFITQKVRANFTLITIGLIGVIFLVLPGIIGKRQFQVFQGNQWDHFSYLGSSLSLKDFVFRQLSEPSADFLLNHPLSISANQLLQQRPAVSLTLDTISIAPHLSLIDGSYGFLLAQLVFLGLAMTLYRKAFAHLNRVNTKLQAILLVAFLIGFWGQYLFDLNAWSSLVCASIFVSIPLFCLNYFENQRLSSGLVTILLATSSLITYPEGFLFFLPAYAIFILLVWRKSAISLFKVLSRSIVGLTTIIILALVSNPYLLQYLKQQGRMASGNASKGWAGYFDAYYFGSSGHIGNFHQLDFLRTAPMGLLGLYQFSPSRVSISSPMGLIILLLNLLFICLLIYVGIRMLRSLGQSPINDFIVFLLLMAILILKVSTAWSAGKALSYFVPLLFIVIVSNVSAQIKSRSFLLKYVTWSLILIWTLGQFSFASTRVLDSYKTGIAHNFPPYIAIQGVSLKSSQDWNFPNLHLRSFRTQCEVYALSVNEPFQNYYAKMELVEQGERWFDLNPIDTYFGVGGRLGKMAQISNVKTCQVVLMQKGATKQFVIVAPPTISG